MKIFHYAAIALTFSFVACGGDDVDDIDPATPVEEDVATSGKAPTGAEAVDLGLPSGTKWANMNVGATSTEGYGFYYAWGETTGYADTHTFNWASYSYSGDNMNSLTKYNTNTSYGHVDNLTKLSLADDAAYQQWGKEWCMPTRAQYEELINGAYTTCTLKTEKGVEGLQIKSNKNGNSIFLPAAGYPSSGILKNGGVGGYYWTCELDVNGSAWASHLSFYSNTQVVEGRLVRCYGRSVRAVKR